jgi:hypothetical protein
MGDSTLTMRLGGRQREFIAEDDTDITIKDAACKVLSGESEPIQSVTWRKTRRDTRKSRAVKLGSIGPNTRLP